MIYEDSVKSAALKFDPFSSPWLAPTCDTQKH
jgi:hypothetical protein